MYFCFRFIVELVGFEPTSSGCSYKLSQNRCQISPASALYHESGYNESMLGTIYGLCERAPNDIADLATSEVLLVPRHERGSLRHSLGKSTSLDSNASQTRYRIDPVPLTLPGSR